MDFIPVADLEHGRAYRIKSRNLRVGFWNADKDGFVGVREKFGDRYLFTEHQWRERGGTANALEALDVYAGDIPVQEHIGLMCRFCDTPIEQIWEDAEREDGTVWKKCVGDRHLEDTDCVPEESHFGYWKMNKPLFDLIDELDQWFVIQQREEWSKR